MYDPVDVKIAATANVIPRTASNKIWRSGMTWRRLLVVMAAFGTLSLAGAQEKSLPFPPAAMLNRITPEGIRANMNYLADDMLEGRGTGTRGYELAALYVRSRFEELGLKPAGVNGGYFQPVPLRRMAIVPETSTFEISRGRQIPKTGDL